MMNSNLNYVSNLLAKAATLSGRYRLTTGKGDSTLYFIFDLLMTDCLHMIQKGIDPEMDLNVIVKALEASVQSLLTTMTAVTRKKQEALAAALAVINDTSNESIEESGYEPLYEI